MKEQPFSLKKRIKSFAYAFNGLAILVKTEHNFRIHLAATLAVLVTSIYFEVSVIEAIALILTIAMVLTAEAFNSAIENISDFISPDKHHKIKIIKDIAAGAVLISAIAALCVGLLIFVPKILSFIQITNN